MSRWYMKVTADPDDLSPVVEAFAYFEAQHEDAAKELRVTGRRIEDVAKMLPGIVEFRWGQLQEIEAILRYIEIREGQKLGEKRRMFLEHYNRQLTDRMAEKYAEADPEVVDLALIRNQMSLVRNKFVALTKGFEYLHFQLSNLVKLRVAGVEDATI